MPAVTLVTPNSALRGSYRRLVGEFVERGETLAPFVLSFDDAFFAMAACPIPGSTSIIGVKSCSDT